MKSKRNKRVVVAVDLAHSEGQRHFRGLTRFLQSHRTRWDLRLKRTVLEFTAPQVDSLPDWDIDGVIYAHPQQIPEAREALAHLAGLDIPLVVIDPGDSLEIARRTRDTVLLRTDPNSVGETAARSFLAQGRCLGYGYVPDVLDRSWSRERGVSFEAALAAHGATCRTFRPSSVGINDFSEICAWLAALPKPAGVLAAYDDRALTVIEACAATGLAIPRDVSLLSVDDDDLLCESCTPTLSSIRPDQERAGYAAGALLASLMRKGAPGLHVTTLPVKSVTHRGSTLAASPAGRLVQRALAHIRKNVCRDIGPRSVAAALGVSRPLLDLRFRELLKTSVGKTIRAERLKAACAELTSGDATLKEIAERCGYSDAAQLMHRFKASFGMTMREWRRNARR